MTYTRKKAFISELVRNVKRGLIADVDRVPESWDGHELRRWIADRFERSAIMGDCMRDKRKSRRRDYENIIIVRNL